MKGIKRKSKIKDNKLRRSGEVLWGEDPHNIQVMFEGGYIQFYCIVRDCPHYNADQTDIKEQDDE